ncbi:MULTISPECIES: hypothetical protein [Ralstonia]|nr:MULTISPECIES: hypothetical protein [Ralstonia]MBY4706304.1 hypothetical protein [Ralstonia insidiosa]
MSTSRMRIFLRRDITSTRCFAQTLASREPNIHAGLQQHAMLCACRSQACARTTRELCDVVHVSCASNAMRVEKNDARIRQRARIFRAIARNRRAARMRIDTLNVFIDFDDALLTRSSLACNARCESAMQSRWTDSADTTHARAAIRAPCIGRVIVEGVIRVEVNRVGTFASMSTRDDAPTSSRMSMNAQTSICTCVVCPNARSRRRASAPTCRPSRRSPAQQLLKTARHRV